MPWYKSFAERTISVTDGGVGIAVRPRSLVSINAPDAETRRLIQSRVLRLNADQGADSSTRVSAPAGDAVRSGLAETVSILGVSDGPSSPPDPTRPVTPRDENELRRA